MVFGAIPWRGKPSLIVVPNTLNSAGCIEILQDHVVSWAEEKYSQRCTLQKDRAFLHAAHATIQYLVSASVDVLEWPFRSPDLNPLENTWALLVRKVYAHGRQLEYEYVLIEAIRAAWDSIEQDLIITLLRSILKRCIEFVGKRVGPMNF